MQGSRVDKFEKRRHNTKLLSVFILVGSILIVVLAGMFIFGGDDKADGADDQQTSPSSQEQEPDSESSPEEQNQSSGHKADSDTNDEETSSSADSNTETDTDEDNTDQAVDTEQAEPSDDNVTEAYKGDWQPVGTEQSEPHSTNYDEDSQDRQEMRKAVAAATGLNRTEFTMWWVERNGDGKVINTVSDPDGTKTYRVYNTWVSGEGWQPTKVEELKENDQKWRFE